MPPSGFGGVDAVELIGEAGAGGAVGDVVVDAGSEVQDVGLEAAGRQVLEIVAVEVGVGGGARGVDRGGVRGHDEGLGDGGDVELDRDVLGRAGHQRHALDAHRLEAVEGDSDGVDAGRHSRGSGTVHAPRCRVRAPPISAGLEISTLAPGTAAPESSVTVPVSAAVVLLWAHAPLTRGAPRRGPFRVCSEIDLSSSQLLFAFGSPKRGSRHRDLARWASARSLPYPVFVAWPHNSAEGEADKGWNDQSCDFVG